MSGVYKFDREGKTSCGKQRAHFMARHVLFSCVKGLRSSLASINARKCAASRFKVFKL